MTSFADISKRLFTFSMWEKDPEFFMSPNHTKMQSIPLIISCELLFDTQF